MTVVIPQALQLGDTIAFISPSSRRNESCAHRIERASSFFQSQGFKVKEIYTSISPDASLKSSVETRVAEIHAAFSDPTVSAIICTIGGDTCDQLLPHIDYELIRNHPKIFCGLSDITLLIYAFYVQAGLRSFYGPQAIAQWGEFPQPFGFTIRHFFDVVMGPAKSLGRLPCSEKWTDDEPTNWLTKADLERPRIVKRTLGWKWVRAGKGEGPLFAACVPALLYKIINTKYDLPSWNGVVLVLELPKGDDHAGVPFDQAKVWISGLALRGIFDQIQGLVLGRPFRWDEGRTERWEDFILETTSGSHFPILSRTDVGHIDPILTLPIGAISNLDSVEGIWSIDEPGVV